MAFHGCYFPRFDCDNRAFKFCSSLGITCHSVCGLLSALSAMSTVMLNTCTAICAFRSGITRISYYLPRREKIRKKKIQSLTMKGLATVKLMVSLWRTRVRQLLVFFDLRQPLVWSQFLSSLSSDMPSPPFPCPPPAIPAQVTVGRIEKFRARIT